MKDYKILYENALERVKDFTERQIPPMLDKKIMHQIFPELKESEDERIRKEILQLVSISGNGNQFEEIKDWLEKQGEHANFRNKIQVGDEVTRNEDGVLVNLSQLNRVAKKKDEKQGEQKSDKVEPKFKVGDWIINNDKRIAFPTQILKIEEYGYVTSRGYISFDKVKTDYHLWIIQDAKEGDVLATDSGRPFIFKGLLDMYHRESPVAYCGIAPDNYFDDNSDINNEWWTDENVYPATKEQRDLLFQKMKEAGYEWDSEKKELRKIEQKPKFCHHEVDLSNCSEEYRKAYYDGWNNCNQQHEQLKAEQKPAWSEEDEKMFVSVLHFLNTNRINERGKVITWVESLPKRFSLQPKQEWSEEDEKMLKSCITILEQTSDVRNEWPLNKPEVDWLKSLKPQPHWKPSEEQMQALLYALGNGGTYNKEALTRLYNDFKNFES